MTTSKGEDMSTSRNRRPAQDKQQDARPKPEIHCSFDSPVDPFLAEIFTGQHTFKGGVKGISVGKVTFTITRELAEQAIICGWSLGELFAEAARLQFPYAKDIEIFGTAPPSRRSAQFTV
jgi:hypothetical protein